MIFSYFIIFHLFLYTMFMKESVVVKISASYVKQFPLSSAVQNIRILVRTEIVVTW